MHDDPRARDGAPFDGTRRAWEALADRLLAGTEPFASPTGALVTMPGPSSASGPWSDGLEGFARTFLLAAFRLRGAGGADPHGLVGRYRTGLLAGVDPDGPERWPTISERRQAVVEAASVAIALSETRPWLWDTLDDGERQRVVAWLSGVVGTAGYTNNWIWFQNVIEAFLASVGGPWRQADLDRNAEIQESLYVGDGWYSDGASPTGARQSFDYYAGWAWHVYPLLHARIAGIPLASVHRERLAAFIDQARTLVGAGGAPLLQGRSLTYRFAMLAPLWAGAIAGVTPLAAGQTRALGTEVVSHFLDAGAVDAQGLLPIGWHRSFPRIRQLYTGGSSPYWASKGFLGLLLPDDHDEWCAVPAAPEREQVSMQALPAPGWLVVSSAADGIVRVLNHGSDGFRGPAGAVRTDNPFYQRIGYSNTTSPELSPGSIASPLDSHVALLDARGAASHRDVIERVHLDGRVAVSRSRVHWLDTDDADAATWASLRRGPVVTTASVVHGVDELRLAWWTAPATDPRPHAAVDGDAAWPEGAAPWRFRIGGWALPVEAEVPLAQASFTRADGVTTAVVPVRGLDVRGVEVRSGSNPFAAHAVIPWAAQSVAAGAGELVAALVVLSGTAPEHPGAVPEILIEPVAVRVQWPDGTVDVVPTGGQVRA
ncbi:DUF2264 domain-containing protein [Microbacterium sp. W1N]|uniref:DUF2264 domain-containing protein n=1 Tax=Microbacterium festucae TaxID=2977531 RepID=UPI0021C1C155|nr:DUF2264 domain-containing protein [Microbacterium festucae]MCT9819175.1 DUF2264 domain-containing protein [Microbacterium festucae]